jgi:16S rRNA (guanine1207-N2)-methyltransferase
VRLADGQDGRVSEDHYFSADPAVPFKREPLVAEVWGRRLSLVSGSGVFARGRLDIGTSVLFRETEPPQSGRVLDLGCGYGVIGLGIAVASHATTVTGVDVNERAVLLANENAGRLGVTDRFAARTPAEVPADARYDEIWSNPPIRIGKPAMHALLQRWLPRLTPDGVAWLVVARNLGADSLQRWLNAESWRAERHAHSKGFRILAVRRH